MESSSSALTTDVCHLKTTTAAASVQPRPAASLAQDRGIEGRVCGDLWLRIQGLLRGLLLPLKRVYERGKKLESEGLLLARGCHCLQSGRAWTGEEEEGSTGCWVFTYT